MKYVIITIHDAFFEKMIICDCGKNTRKNNGNKDILEEWVHFCQDSDFREWIKEKYKDYALIILSINGEIEVLKDGN